VDNGTYYLLTTTNESLPVASWTPVATNSFDSSGNFSITNAIDHTKKQQFFLIDIPY